ncbi:unnamed protein product, partial [Lymnaea stagnalis]
SLNEYQTLYEEFTGSPPSPPLPADAPSPPLPNEDGTALFPADCGVTNVDPSEAIVGGDNTTAAAWPWQVVVVTRHVRCGGVLVSDRWVLTSAHCIGPDIVVYIGLQKIVERLPTQDGIKVSKAVTHPQFKLTNQTVVNDIALLKLSARLNISDRVRPACLPSRDEEFTQNPLCFVTGFGETVPVTSALQSSRLKLLKKLHVEVVYHRLCRYVMKLVKHVITGSHLCVMSVAEGGSSCNGDSGGPLSCKVNGRYYVAGVTSYVIDNCLGVMPMVFTRVAHYKDWLIQELRRN